VGWTTFLPILVYLGRFILGLSANTYQTHSIYLITIMVSVVLQRDWLKEL